MVGVNDERMTNKHTNIVTFESKYALHKGKGGQREKVAIGTLMNVDVAVNLYFQCRLTYL